MQTNRDVAEPEVVVEGGESAARSERTWRIATIAVIVLTLFVCLCFGGILVLNPFQPGGSNALAAPTATRRGAGFAATWTPTPTDTATPTAPPRPTATSTSTPTATATASNTPVPATPTRTPPPPTNTARPRPTNTPRPPTSTPVPPPTATNTPSYQFSVSSPTSYFNQGSMGVFGTVRDRNGNLVGDVKIEVIAPSGSGLEATTTPNFKTGSTDRNFEVSNADGLTPGTYAVFARIKVGSDYMVVSPSVTVNITPLNDACNKAGDACTQWWKIEFKQN
ncbi:MAG: hypothetical protein HZB53_00640 [Chloroflexi bacterium]|nr:hypothetical protein [Chloroflexota bacterium]